MVDEFPVPPDNAAQRINEYDEASKRVVMTQDDLAKSQHKAAEEANFLSKATEIAKNGMGELSKFVSGSSNMIQNLSSSMQQLSQKLSVTGALTETQARQFAFVTTAIVGAKKEYSDLSNVKFDGLNTFSEQLATIAEMGGDSTTVIGKLSDAAKAMGAEMPGPAKASVELAKGFMTNLLQSADNNTRLRSTILQLSAQTGELGGVYAAAGSHMQNMTMIVQDQDLAIQKTAESAGLSKDEVAKYFSQLAMIPGTMKDMVQVAGGANDKISMLSATMKLATGTGRSFSEVQATLASVYDQFNVRGEDALKFTARISELTNKFGPLGIQFKEINKGMMESTSLFKNITDSGAAATRMTEGISSVMNEYVGSLMKTGMTGERAIGTVKGMTEAVAGLTIGQKAFLSAQTGGPGGLMGGYQIQKMMQDGDIKGVMDKVQQQMKKQLGSIVTLDDAAKSDVAANQMTRQIQILKSGPLGSMIKSDDDATKFLKMMKDKEMGKETSSDLSKNPLLDGKGGGLLEKGTELQQMQLSELSKIRSIIEGARTVNNGVSASIVNEALSSSSGAYQGSGKDPLSDQRDKRRSDAIMADGQASDILKRSAQEIKTGMPTNKSGEMAYKNMQAIKTTASGLTDNIMGGIGIIKEGLVGEVKPSVSVGGAAKGSSEMKKKDGSSASAVMPEQKPQRQTLDINISAKCVTCGKDVEHSAHRDALNPASTAQTK